MRHYILWVAFLLPFAVMPQTTISGVLKDVKGAFITSASVTINVMGINGNIIAYDISDDKGNYRISFKYPAEKVQINVRSIGYEYVNEVLINKTQIKNFELLEQVTKLNEIALKFTPITQKGDTINYLVSSFQDQKDRVIADVLKKLPGIDVLADGKILYQGKPILKYYIEGIDLLEGRYNIANNNLPADAVAKVQILENHQPIKLLDSLVFSDKAALNIKLKKKVTTTGVAKLGVGLAPLLWDVNITPMLFTKKRQMITSYQANNIGNDISSEIKILTIEDLLDQFESKNEKQDWISIQLLSSPPFAKNRWLNNNANLFTTNYLVRLKKEVDLKINLSYINDFQRQNGNTKTTFLTQTDTINIIESTKNKLFFNVLKSEFVLIKNTKKSYFKNTLETNNFWDAQKGFVIANNEALNQNATIPFSSFSNILKQIKPIGKKLVTINSVVTYNNDNQSLKLSPGQFKELLNNDNPSDILNQYVMHSNFYTNNAFSFTKRIRKMTFTPKIGFNLQNQKLNSHISLFEDKNENKLTGSFQNNLRFNQTSFYSILNTQYRNDNWKIELETPFKLQTFDRIDDTLNKKQNLYRFTFEPRLSINKPINAFWETTFSSSLKNSFGSINQLYYGYILNSYRTIQQFDTPILESLKRNLSFSISYRNPIKSLFINGHYSFENSNQNLIFGNIINSNGTSSFGFIEQNNNSNSHHINLRGSKFFSKIKTTLTLTTNTLFDNQIQILNGSLTDVNIKNIELNGKLDTKFTEWMSISLKTNISISNTKFKNQSFRNILTQEHLLNIDFYPSSNQYIGFDAEYYKNNFSFQNNVSYFLNLNYRFTFNKSKTDLALNWNNILNTKEFTTAFNESFSYLQSTYQLRPSQVLISLKFRF